MLATTQNKKIGTIVEDGEADESVGIDVLVYWYMSDEEDFWGFDGLANR